jgi:hypothetical protein
MQAARDIEGEHLLAAAIDGFDGFGRGAGNRSRKADAENRIDDDIGPTQAVRVPADDRPARGYEIVVRTARIALQSRGLV